MNEQLQKRRSELEALVANVQAELEVAQGNGFTPGSAAARENDILLKGYRKQLSDFQAQIASIDTEARRFEKAQQEAEEIHKRQEAERQTKAEAERRKAEEVERQRRIAAEEAREKDAKAHQERLAAQERTRAEAADSERRRQAAEKAAALKDAEREKENRRQQGVEIVSEDGQKAGTFLLTVPGYGSIRVQFIPEVEAKS